jgi:hypothetical protein
MTAQQLDHVAGTAASTRNSLIIYSPYIGLKPYSENEQALFFGRERDAQFLVDKILSAPLTLMYGMSGVGKSSLLRARVIPDLRSPDVAGALVIYVFDCWTEPDVEAAIKRTIAREVAKLIGHGRPVGPGLAAPLLDWARYVNNALGKPFVLILDQFEQFLLHRAGRLDPLRRELASLVRAKADVYVVLALREEYLASLEVFTHDIVNIYDSTFRLEHLTDDGARDAIVCRAKTYGVMVVDDLTDALIRDLKVRVFGQSLEQVGVALGEANIELPVLQILCEQLWKNRDPTSSSWLTPDLYRRMGQRDGIIATYLADLTRGLRAPERDDAAAILDWLAPRSGLKTPCSVDQLVALTRLSAERINRLLTHFEIHWVLRPIAGGRYELYHDAFIKVLRNWIDARLDDVKRRQRVQQNWRRAKQIIEGIGVLVVVGLCALGANNWLKMPSEQESCVIEEGLNTSTGPTGGTELVYHDGLNAQLLDCFWGQFNRKLRQANSPVVLPVHISPKADDGQSTNSVTLRLGRDSDKLAKISVDIPLSVYDRVLLDHDRLPVPFRSLSSPLDIVDSPEADDLGFPSIATLPAWTSPLLRTLGVYPLQTEQAVITAVARQLVNDPRPTLTQQVVDYLLEQTSRSSPETVKEAVRSQPREYIRDVRKRFRDVLREIATLSDNKTNLNYEHLDLILDAMARHTAFASDPHTIGNEILKDLRRLSTQLPPEIALHGAKPVSLREIFQEKSALLQDYQLRAEEIPRQEDRPQVALGKDLVSCIADESGAIKETINQRWLDQRNSYRLTLPEVQFIRAEEGMTSEEFVIEVAGQYF